MLLTMNSNTNFNRNSKPNVTSLTAGTCKSMERARTATARNTRLSPAGYTANHPFTGAHSPRNTSVKLIKCPAARPHDQSKSLVKAVPRAKTPYPFFNSSSSLRTYTPLVSLTLSSLGSNAQPSTEGGQKQDKYQEALPITLSRDTTEKKKIAKTEIQDGILNLWMPTPAPATLHRMTPMSAYDINTKLPFRILETDQVRLEPLIPAKHLEGFMSLPKESWDVLGDMGPFDTLESALEEIEEFRNDPRSLLLAAVDKQREAKGMSCFAGVYGLIEYNVDQGNILFGCINIHPMYHRTHINSQSMNLILTFLFETAKVIRIQYDAVTWNEASINAALRFGFKHEGICRNLGGIIPEHKKRAGETHLKSQDLWLSSMTDAEWEGGVKERLAKMCERHPVDTTRA